MTIQTVDEFVQQRVPPALQPTVARLRELMRELAPSTRELISYGMPVFCGKNIIAYITAVNKYVTFSFTVGVQFEDKYGLLRGAGKHARYLRYKTPEDINKTIVRYYVKQALAKDRK
jgi:hypothetical protein